MVHIATWTRTSCAVVLLSVALPLPSEAQRERVIIRTEALATTAIDAPPGNVNSRDIDQQSLHVNLAHRLITNGGNTMVLLGAQFRDVRVALPQQRAATAPSAPPSITPLRMLTADLWMLHTLNAQHTLIAVARPGVYGDLEAIGDQWRVEGALFVDRIVSSRVTLGAGMSYASNFGRVLAVPVVHVVARPKRRILIDALLPSRADVWWMPRKGLDLGVGAALTGAQYGVAAETRAISNANAVWLANATVGPQVRWTPAGKVQITADVGSTVLRRLEYARDGRSLADLAPGNVFFARLGAQWLF
jgi:Domain of unknown function (DUF6268)